MPRILTVDDTRELRLIAAKQITDLGFEVEEAENGEEGLARLQELDFDLVLLDVSMPVLDGPGMLKRMREQGNRTPVVMVTSESSRSIVAEAMRLGIVDYLLKPFKGEELREKILKALKLPLGDATDAARPGDSEATSAETGGPPEASRRQLVDVLLVDDMENVAKKLRSLLPAHVSLHSCLDARDAVSHCRANTYRVALIDTEMPDVGSAVLLNQLRALQPDAAFIALSLRSRENALEETKSQGFGGLLFKPFGQAEIDDVLGAFFDNPDLVVIEDNVLSVCAYAGREDRIDRYYRRVAELVRNALEDIAAACFDEAIVDFTQLSPSGSQSIVRMIVQVEEASAKVGVSMRYVGPAEIATMLGKFVETKKLKVFPSLEEAKVAA